MDSITQIALGAAVGEVVLGRQVGRRAMLWGGICGLFPDLDLLVPLNDAVKEFTYHRGPSHSLFVLAALTPLFVWLILKLHRHTVQSRNRWYGLVFLVFATHVLLDCFTVYGTQIFWPLKTPPIMWSTIFIIDPAYSLPLLIGVLAALNKNFLPNRRSFQIRILDRYGNGPKTSRNVRPQFSPGQSRGHTWAGDSGRWCQDGTVKSSMKSMKDGNQSTLQRRAG